MLFRSRSLSNYTFPLFFGEWGLDKENVASAWDNKGDIVIGNDVWIGYEAVIMSGVHVGEVVSSSTKKKDYALKLSKYMEAGVREYWILDFAQEKVLVYFFESDVYPVIYGFDKPVPVNIYNGELKIDFTNIARWLKEGME